LLKGLFTPYSPLSIPIINGLKPQFVKGGKRMLLFN
jgi:hypothetical protein